MYILFVFLSRSVVVKASSLFLSMLFSVSTTSIFAHQLLSPSIKQSRRSLVGVFRATDKALSGITYGNWGSRPYEYAWASSLTSSLENARIIDLGVGLPSQYTWYKYVVEILKPLYYVGIDCDSRIKDEIIKEKNYEITYMNMASLSYADNSFDAAYCISTFEHIPYNDFIKSIQEVHRTLKPGGLLIVTLDEEWDRHQPSTYDNGWNILEKSLEEKGLFQRKRRSFGLPEFAHLIQDYFSLIQDDAVIDINAGTIRSSRDGFLYYNRINRDPLILNSGDIVNSCVSYGVFIKK